MLFRTTVALCYHTTPGQLRRLLVKLREMLLVHPRVTMAPSRVRVVGFGEYSIKIEIFAYVNTSDWDEFMAVREDLILRIMDIVKNAGTELAVPSRALYHGPEPMSVAEERKAAEGQVREWVAEGALPFPDFSPEYRKKLRNTLDYPPKGSVAAEKSESS